MTERAAFEAWIRGRQRTWQITRWYTQHGLIEYIDPAVELAWCAWQERAKKVDTLEERLREFRNAQKPLPEDFAKVLNDNLWDLSRSEEKPE